MHIPLDKLPVDIQKRIVAYLQADNFAAAKDIRDEYERHLQSAKENWKKRLKSSRNNAVRDPCVV